MSSPLGARLGARTRQVLEAVRRRALGAAPAASRGAVQLVGLAGFAAFVEGVRRVYVPAAFMLAGALLVAWAVVKSSRSAP